MRNVLCTVITAALLLAGCGDNPSEPGNPTPSDLSAEFTGEIEEPPMSCQVTLEWTMCPDDDFERYTLFRSPDPGIEDDTTGADNLVSGFSADVTQFLDDDVIWGSSYHYALLTMNTQGFVSFSNEAEITTPEAPLPAGMEFVTVPAGSFEMGSPPGDPGSFEAERPVHTVTFDYSFEIMTTEVTQAMWEELMQNPWSDPSHFSGPDRPVDNILWEECLAFADAMNELDPGHEYRLPSEAEWEYACRAGTTTRFYWGDDPGYTEIWQYAWFSENSGGETHPVGEKLPNSLGLFDMSGNGWEWCLDTWHADYEGAPADGSAWMEGSADHIIRGGGWIIGGRYCRSAHREYISAGNTYSFLGFRLVRTAR